MRFQSQHTLATIGDALGLDKTSHLSWFDTRLSSSRLA